jgi:hypothetical protein
MTLFAIALVLSRILHPSDHSPPRPARVSGLRVADDRRDLRIQFVAPAGARVKIVVTARHEDRTLMLAGTGATRSVRTHRGARAGRDVTVRACVLDTGQRCIPPQTRARLGPNAARVPGPRS